MLGLEEDSGNGGEKRTGREMQVYVCVRERRDEGWREKETETSLSFQITAISW